MEKLLVHKTLMTGRRNHWMMSGSEFSGNVSYDDCPAELYELYAFHLALITLFELACGWEKKWYNKLDCWVFVKK